MNRTDILLLVTLASNNANTPYYGLTITEIMDCISELGCTKTRMTVYRRIKRLLSSGYIAKGILDDHADTYYILDSGKDLINSWERKANK